MTIATVREDPFSFMFGGGSHIANPPIFTRVHNITKGSSIYYVITYRGGSPQMITDYIFVTDQTSAFHKILYLYIG